MASAMTIYTLIELYLLEMIAKIMDITKINKDLVDLAISITEIDTGITLSLQERQDMVERILAKIEDANY
jgi:hypothetical protein